MLIVLSIIHESWWDVSWLVHVLKIGSEFWEFQQTESWSVVDTLDIQTLHYRIKFEFGLPGGRGLLAGSRFARGDIISDLSQFYNKNWLTLGATSDYHVIPKCRSDHWLILSHSILWCMLLDMLDTLLYCMSFLSEWLMIRFGSQYGLRRMIDAVESPISHMAHSYINITRTQHRTGSSIIART